VPGYELSAVGHIDLRLESGEFTGAILSVSGLGGAPLATLPPEGPAMLTGKQAYGGKGPAKAKKPGVLTTRRRR
jgi:hypothetical protein